MARNKNRRTIHATEISRFCFCPTQWWYVETTGRKPKVTKAMKAGLKHHLDEGKKVNGLITAQRSFVSSLIVGGIACLVMLLLALLS